MRPSPHPFLTPLAPPGLPILRETRGPNPQIVNEHRLVDWRAVTNVRRDQELVELQRCVCARPEQNVVPIENQHPVEPVLHHTVLLPDSVHDRVQLKVGFDEVPVVFIAGARTWLKHNGTG